MGLRGACATTERGIVRPAITGGGRAQTAAADYVFHDSHVMRRSRTTADLVVSRCVSASALACAGFSRHARSGRTRPYQALQ
jgi:hypothetical protein